MKASLRLQHRDLSGPVALTSRSSFKRWTLCQPRRICCMSQNGTGHDRSTTTRTMFVADLDMSSSSTDVPSTSTRTVDVPANGVVARGKLGSASAAGAIVRAGGEMQLAKDNHALKDELLRTKAELAAQSHDVLELRSKLAERDRSLQLTKSELIETRITLQERETQLQEAYTRLQKATTERAEFRRYLLEAEQELHTTRAELLEWSQGLQDLKNVMEGLDDDLSELVGTSTYAAAMQEIEGTLQQVHGSARDALEGLGNLSLDQKMSDDEMVDITEALRGLQELSRQILEEAKEDTAYFGDI